MYRFSYPAEKWDERELDKRAILDLIRIHEGMVGRLKKNKEYYEGRHAIETKERNAAVDEMVPAPNAKVTCNHAKDITDTATGYFIGNPITYSNTGDGDIAPLLSAFDDANVDDVDADNAQDMSIYGVAYEYVYAKDGEPKPLSKTITPERTFIIVDDSIEENELCGVYYYRKEDTAAGTCKYVATVSTANYKHVLDIMDTAGEQPLTEQPEQHFFGEPQMIEYLNNKEGIGDFEQQIPLIDAYNTLMSDRITDKEQFIDAVLVLYGALLGDDEEEVAGARKKLRKDKLLELPVDAKAEYLARQFDENGVEVLRKAIKEDIYNFSHVPNFADENFAGNASGVAMEYKLLGLEMLTKVKERYYRKGLRKRARLYCSFLNMKAVAMESGSIVPTFSRALPKNLQELSQIVSNLKGSVSARTLLKLLPFVEDPDYELEEAEKQKEEEIKRQQELFGQWANAAPEAAEEDEETMDKKKGKESAPERKAKG